MRVVCISDTHLQHDFEVPDGDVLVHAGDATFQGTAREVRRFSAWFGSLPHKHKVFVPGNHDWGFERELTKARALLPPCHLLIDTGVELEGFKFWGSPWQPWFLDWAFNLPRGPELKAHWDLIPADTDVLVTHTPPYGIGDRVARGEHVGCEDMRDALARVQPKLHVFGHIHGGYGTYKPSNTIFVNAAICDESYQPTNQPIAVDL